MPVYERGYKHWEPSGRKAAPPWWVIARRGISEPLKRRGILFLLVLAWIPAIVKGGILFFYYKAGNLVELLGGSWVDIAAPGFFVFLEKQRYFVLIMLTIIGTRLIANDRRENGLALYFARPMSLLDYIAGKSLIILFYYFMVTLFPVYALSIYGYLVTSGGTGLEMLFLTPLRATVFCVISGVSLSLVLLALSSLGTRAIFITVGWVLLFFGSQLLASILKILGQGWMHIIDFPTQYFQTGAFLFGAEAPANYPPLLSGITLSVTTLLAILILRHRIRPVEVVS